MAENDDKQPDRNHLNPNKSTQQQRPSETETMQMPAETDDADQKLETKEQMTYRYDRDQMLAIRATRPSRTRPEELSKEFDNEDGLFSPDKWLQHRWLCEGVENRVKRVGKTVVTSGGSIFPYGIGTTTTSSSKLLNSIMEAAASNNTGELDQQIVLSPQRRGFSSGCRAASPNKGNDEEKPSSKSRWRQGPLSNGLDFKPAFQKTALEANSRSSRIGSTSHSHSSNSNATQSAVNNNSGGNGSWMNVGATKQHGWDKDKNRRGYGERRSFTHADNEPIPEWMDGGPTSHLDVIELKGFDDEPDTRTDKSQRQRRSRGKENGPKTTLQQQPQPLNKAGATPTTSREKSSSGRAGSTTPRSSLRRKRHSGGDIHNHPPHPLMNIPARPLSRHTPNHAASIGHAGVGTTSRKNSSHSPIHFIQASDLESSILKEQQEKLDKEKLAAGNNGKAFDLFSALGIEPKAMAKASSPHAAAVVDDHSMPNSNNKLPNSDAEFAAFILGVPANQIAKPVAHGHNAGVVSAISSTAPMPSSKMKQQQEPTTSRLSRFFAKNNSVESNAAAGDEQGAGGLMMMNSSAMMQAMAPLNRDNEKDSIVQLNRSPFDALPMGRQSTSPTSNLHHHMHMGQGHLPRPASAELLAAQLSSSSPHLQSHLFPRGGAVQQNKFSGLMTMPLGASAASPDFMAQQQREADALFQQMLQANNSVAPFPGHGHNNLQAFSSPTQAQMQQQLLDKFRRSSPSSMSMYGQGQGQPSSVELQLQQMLLNSSTGPMSMFQQQQRQQSPFHQMGPPSSSLATSSSNNGSGGGGGGGIPFHLQHLIHQTARNMSPNPNMPLGADQIRAAYAELLKDPKMRAAFAAQHNQSLVNQLVPPQSGGFGGGNACFPNGPPFTPHQQQFFDGFGPSGGGFRPNAFNNPGSGAKMAHQQQQQFGGGFFPPNGPPMPMPPFSNNFQHSFGAGPPLPPPPPPFFHPGMGAMFPPLMGGGAPPPHSQPMPMPMPPFHKSMASNFVGGGNQPGQQQSSLLNTPAFMPTSVMRQMSKMPGGGGSSVTSGGEQFISNDLGCSTSMGGTGTSSMFLQKLFGGGGGEPSGLSQMKPGRAILGRDPTEDLSSPPKEHLPCVSGCLKLEDIERELAVCQQQQQQQSMRSTTTATTSPNVTMTSSAAAANPSSSSAL